MSRPARRSWSCSSSSLRGVTSEIAVIQFQDDAGPGLLESWAAQRELVLHVCRPDLGEELPDRPAAVIVLGSDKSSNDETVAFTRPLVMWAADVLAAGTALLGICFGAQVMARALGARVERMLVPEIGWVVISPSDGDGDGVTPGPWMAWHEDAITPGDTLDVVATNDRGLQAFRAAPGQLGVQFHPEVTPQIVAAWAAVDGSGRQMADAGTTTQKLEHETARFAPVAAHAAYALFDGWARSAGF